MSPSELDGIARRAERLADVVRGNEPILVECATSVADDMAELLAYVADRLGFITELQATNTRLLLENRELRAPK